MDDHVFVGFGFGPIQSGLFASEAFKSGSFNRIVIAETDRKLVEAVSENNGSYYVNIASDNGIIADKIDGIEILNLTVEHDRGLLAKALSQATEIVTSLPSVDFYDMGSNSPASLIRHGLENTTAPATIVYTAENNNRAAEILEEKVGSFNNVRFLNTVIGKMSQVLDGACEVEGENLKTITPEFDRAFLVELFNKILVTRCSIKDFTPGIKVFLEKDDLLPFEETKLYGHNAVHALLAYSGAEKGYDKMSDIKNDTELMNAARDAFIDESGAALIKKYAHLDDGLFTGQGYRAYACDLLERITSRYLSYPVERAARDPRRKLSPNDRIFGTMQVALENGIKPFNMAKGAAAGIKYLAGSEGIPDKLDYLKSLFLDLWGQSSSIYRAEIMDLTMAHINF